ncbi:MAG: hypothetical protein ACJAZV_002069 [Roseivirga sp.]|jgi:hypothetical protein
MRRILTLVFLMSVIMNAFAQQNDDENAIIQVLEKESRTWRSGDIKGHAECWVIRPYGKILISTGDGNVLDIPVEMIVNPTPEMVGQGGTSKNTDYQMSVQGNSAWVSHEEESISADGVSTFSSEIRMLEKVEGQWKLVGQSIHIKKG